MDTKITTNGNVQVWAIPAASVADYRSITAAELNTFGLDVTAAIAWEGTTFPTASESDDVDDRSLRDKGNATSRGAAQFEATLSFFYPTDFNENETDYGKAFQFFKASRVPVYLVTRVLQGTEGVHTDAVAGQWISVYRFITAGWAEDLAGDTSYKYAVSFLTQGEVAVYTQVKNATPVTLTNASGSGSLTVGGHAVIRATLGGKRATQVVEWSSSDTEVATVSQNGVVTGVSAGTADITATHRAATGATTPIAITVA